MTEARVALGAEQDASHRGHEMTVCRRPPCDGLLRFSKPDWGSAHDCRGCVNDGGGCVGIDELCVGTGRCGVDIVLLLSSDWARWPADGRCVVISPLDVRWCPRRC